MALASVHGATDDHGFGPVDPVALPDISVTRHDGVRVGLREVFAGRRSALQFVFVDCTTACPLLGSLFGRVDSALTSNEVQLVSITVNPERDTPARMAGWLAGFQASSRWIGLRPEPTDLPLLLRAFRQETGPPSGHALQVFLVDESSRYVARTTALPRSAAVAAALRTGVGPVQRVAVNAGRVRTITGADLFYGRAEMAAFVGGDHLAPGAVRCSGCHGEDRGGGQEGREIVPPLAAAALQIPHQRRGGPPSAYTEQSFCESLRRGVDPAGVAFSSLMPRYQIDGRSCRQLWEFLTGKTSIP